MKTCLYCGGNNPETARICMICGRDMQSGEVANAAALAKRLRATRALPRPESPYVALMLLAPALVLFILGLAVIFEPAVGWLYDLRLPSVDNVGAVGGFLMLGAFTLLFLMIGRFAGLRSINQGYYAILRSEDGNDDTAQANMYKRYRNRATKLRGLRWLIPIVGFVLIMAVTFIGSVAYYIEIGDFLITMPDIQDPIPYMALELVGLIFLVIQMVATLKTTRAYRCYERALELGEQVGEGTHSGLDAAMDARQYPAPLPAAAYLLLLPAILVFTLLGFAISMAESVSYIMGVYLPLFSHPVLFGSLMFFSALGLAIVMVACMIKQKEIQQGYAEALKMDKDTPFSVPLEKYAHYQKSVCNYYCVLWLLPIVFFIGIIALVNMSSYADYLILLDQYRFVLPEVETPLPYMLMSVVASAFLLVLFFVTRSKTSAFRRCDVINRRRHEEILAREAERAAAEEEAARRAAEAAAEAERIAEEQARIANESSEGGLWDTPAEEESPVTHESHVTHEGVDDPDFFLSGDTSYEPVTPVAEVPVIVDPLDGLIAVDTEQKTLTPAATRKASNLHELCEWFMGFARANGYAPEESSVRALLAAMATSRVVFIRTRDEASAKFAATMAKFFGSNAPVEPVMDGWDTAESLLFTGVYDSKRASDALCGIYRASYEPDSLCAVTLTDAEQAPARVYLSDLLAYSEAPARKRELRLLEESRSKLPARAVSYQETADHGQGVYMDMPANIWCLVVSSDTKNFFAPATGYTTGAALTVSLRGMACEPAEEASEEVGLSASAFQGLVRGITEHHFLPEEQWKKFDRVENFLRDRAGVRFDNRLMRRLETFSSAYMAVDNDANQILDAMLEAVFLPLIADLDPADLQSVDGSAGICETMALAFGADNIPYSMQALHELGFEA